MKEAIEEEIKELERYNENEHVIHMWQPLEFNMDENYNYVPNGKIFTFFSNLIYYGVAMPVIYALTRVLYDLKIEGRENIQNLEGGAVSISNHVLVLDCAMIGLAWDDKKVYYTALADSFKIPIVRRLIRLLRAIPIPIENKNKPYFKNALDSILQDKKIVHFYPEASLWPYYNKIRNFKTGAFHFAVRNNVPIVPMVITFRRPNAIRRVFKSKPDVTLTILEPIKHEKAKDQREEIENLKHIVKKAMEEEILRKKGKNKLLDKKRLEKELDGAINWIKEYVENSKAKGVVIRKQWRKRLSSSNSNGNKSTWKRESFDCFNALQFCCK